MRAAVPVAPMRYLPLLALLCAARAGAAECTVKEFFADASEPGLSVTTPRHIVAIEGRPGTISGAAMPIGRRDAEAEASPEERQKRAIQAAVMNRDLDALHQAVPAEDEARRAMLRKSYALEWAFRSSGLPLVRQIIRWDPAAMESLTPAAKAQMLQAVARTWQSTETRLRAGTPVDHPPAPGDQVELIGMLLDAGADPDGAGDWLTPLGTIASLAPSPEVLRAAGLLLQRGASIEKRSGDGRAALANAAAQQNADLVRLMLQMREPSRDALDEAVVRSPIATSNAALGLLLERGADINADPARFGPGVFFYPAWTAAGLVKFRDEREPLRLLIRYKVDPNRLVNRTDSPLMSVIHDHELMAGLLALGANPNYRSGQGDTPLHLALRVPQQVRKDADDQRPLQVIEPALDPKVRARSVAMLLEAGADPNTPGPSGQTPLMMTGHDDAESVELLLARGGRLNLDERAYAYYRQYRAPIGPVSWSLLRYNDALAAALVRRDGVALPDDCGAVFYAAQTGATRTLAALLDRRVDPKAATEDRGLTPLLVAARHGQAAAVRMLLERKAANVNETTPVRTDLAVGHGAWGVPYAVGGESALILAAAERHKAVVEVLLEHGARVDHASAGGWTALRAAQERGADDIVALLKARGARN